MKKIISILIIFLVLSIVGISGCTDSQQTKYANSQQNESQDSQQSYSDGSIKFNYPKSFQNTTEPGSIISGNGNWIDLINLADTETTAIAVSKNEKIKDPNYARKATDASINTPGGVSTGEVLSHTTETNQNGIQIFKSISTLQDPDTNEKVKYVDFYFKDKKGVVYSISIYDTESNYPEVSNIANIIFNSLNLD